MKASRLTQREARSLFRACIINGALDANRVRQTMRLLIERKPRGYIAILEQLKHWIKLDEARRIATIESAIPLDAAAQAQLREDLQRRYGGNLNFTFVHKPELLGGLRIQVGGDVYNGSVRGRLDALAESF